MPTNEHQGKPPEKASYPCHGCAFLRINYLLIRKCLRTLLYVFCGSAKTKTDVHSCTQVQAIARKGKLLFALKMPTNEHQGKPPQKASHPCHGGALVRIKYLLIRKCLRTYDKETARNSKLPVMWLRCAIVHHLLQCYDRPALL